MGRNNQQRRAAKKRRRQPPAGATRTGPGAGDAGPFAREPGWTTPPSPQEIVLAAVAAWDTDPTAYAELFAALAERPERAVPAVEGQLDDALAVLWEHGWTPADLAHVVGRRLSDTHAAHAAERVVADGRRREADGQALHPRWREQLDSLTERAPAGLLLIEERLRSLLEVLCVTIRLPDVPPTVPRPGDVLASAPAAGAHLDAGMLARVRAVLAKAESTEFTEEAEAYTAKAQELIARYAIDEALLEAADDVGEPSARRLLLDDPYVDAKAYLVDAVAGANRCRVVHSTDLGWVTVFGYDGDLDAVELLSASLLAQATGGMVRQGPRRDATGRSRTRSFRRSFLLGFGQRIGERLRQATDQQMAATDDAERRLLPVLAAREDRLEAAVQAAFPQLRRKSTSIGNGTGWTAGRAAAEQANLEVPAGRLPAR